MEVDLGTVSKITDTVSKIKLWAKEHKGLILIVALLFAVIAFLVYNKSKKLKPEVGHE